MGKTLIVYYSRKGENYYGGSIRNLERGNTEIAAEAIQSVVGGDIFEIRTEKPYSKDYTTCTEEAKKELQEGIRPEIQEFVYNMEDYDTIFVCYPNWWGTCPMCVFTFMESYDFSGKKIIPLCTNEGSGMGRSESDLKKHCRGADVKRGLAVRGCETANSVNEIANWAIRSI